jgi:hypothetical protein
VKPWVFCRGPRESGRPKALALKAFSTFVFLGLVFLGYRLSTLVKERHELSFVKPSVIPPWPKGKGLPKALALRAFSTFVSLGLVFFWDIVYQRW